jgi:3-oxoacyl-[acyl-carrier protein] reductase
LALDADQLDRHYAVNVRATVLMCQEFVRRWQGDARRAHHQHHLGTGFWPDAGRAWPTWSPKAAIDAMTVTLAAELAGRGITVNAVDPGATDTGWMPTTARRHRARTYLGRIGLANGRGQPGLFSRLGARGVDHRAGGAVARGA